jgi:hypothetical protein
MQKICGREYSLRPLPPAAHEEVKERRLITGGSRVQPSGLRSRRAKSSNTAGDEDDTPEKDAEAPRRAPSSRTAPAKGDPPREVDDTEAVQVSQSHAESTWGVQTIYL